MKPPLSQIALGLPHSGRVCLLLPVIDVSGKNRVFDLEDKSSFKSASLFAWHIKCLTQEKLWRRAKKMLQA